MSYSPVFIPSQNQEWTKKVLGFFNAYYSDVVSNSISKIVKVAITPKTGTFYGNADEGHIQMSFRTFWEHFKYYKTADDPLLSISPESEFYLSQCTIDRDRSDDGIIEFPELHSILAPENNRMLMDSHFPRDSYAFRQSNIWINAGPVLTSTHFDGDDNLLCVITGRKLVAVLPPTVVRSPCFQSASLASSAPNHANTPLWDSSLLTTLESTSHASTITLSPYRFCTGACKKLEYCRDSSSVSSEAAYKGIEGQCFVPVVFDLTAGDCLFLPEGWWHSVISAPKTIAVNYWYRRGVRTTISSPRAKGAESAIETGAGDNHTDSENGLNGANCKTGLGRKRPRDSSGMRQSSFVESELNRQQTLIGSGTFMNCDYRLKYYLTRCLILDLCKTLVESKERQMKQGIEECLGNITGSESPVTTPFKLINKGKAWNPLWRGLPRLTIVDNVMQPLSTQQSEIKEVTPFSLLKAAEQSSEVETLRIEWTFPREELMKKLPVSLKGFRDLDIIVALLSPCPGAFISWCVNHLNRSEKYLLAQHFQKYSLHQQLSLNTKGERNQRSAQAADETKVSFSEVHGSPLLKSMLQAISPEVINILTHHWSLTEMGCNQWDAIYFFTTRKNEMHGKEDDSDVSSLNRVDDDCFEQFVDFRRTISNLEQSSRTIIEILDNDSVPHGTLQSNRGLFYVPLDFAFQALWILVYGFENESQVVEILEAGKAAVRKKYMEQLLRELCITNRSE